MSKKLAGLLSVFALVAVVTGCTFSKSDDSDSGAGVSKDEAKNDPQAVLDDSWSKTADVNSAKGEVALTFDIESSSGDGSGSVEMTFAMDATDETEPVGQMSMTASLDMGTAGEMALDTTEFRMTDNKLYFNIAGLDISSEELGGDEITAMFGDYFDQWFVIDPESELVQEMLSSATASVSMTAADEEMTPEQAQKLLDIVSTAKIVTGVTYSTEEKVDGVSCVKISFTGLDADGIIALVEELNTEFGGEDAEEMTASDKKEMKDAIEDIDASGSFWVGKDDGLLRKVDMTLAIDMDGDQATIGIVATMSDYNEAVTVQKPSGAEDFMEAITPLLESFGGSSLQDTTDYSDSSDYSDYYSQEELDELMNSL